MASWEHAQWHSKQLQSAAALKCIVRLRLCKHARCTPPRPCVNTRSLVRQDSGIRATAQRPAAFAAERASTHFCRPLRNTALISWSLRTCNNCLKPAAGSCQPRPAELPAKKVVWSWCHWKAQQPTASSSKTLVGHKLAYRPTPNSCWSVILQAMHCLHK